MIAIHRFAALAALALTAAACTQQEAAPAAERGAPAAAGPETRPGGEPRERAVAVPVPASPPTVVIERPEARVGDSTTVRAGRDGIEVETTNR